MFFFGKKNTTVFQISKNFSAINRVPFGSINHVPKSKNTDKVIRCKKNLSKLFIPFARQCIRTWITKLSSNKRIPIRQIYIAVLESYCLCVRTRRVDLRIELSD